MIQKAQIIVFDVLNHSRRARGCLGDIWVYIVRKRGNVCGEMLLSSHITLTFLITPQNFCLMGKTNCLIAPNGNDMKSKFQKDAMGNSTCNWMALVSDCLDVSVTCYWDKTPFYVLPQQRCETSRRSKSTQCAVCVDFFGARPTDSCLSLCKFVHVPSKLNGLSINDVT